MLFHRAQAYAAGSKLADRHDLRLGPSHCHCLHSAKLAACCLRYACSTSLYSVQHSPSPQPMSWYGTGWPLLLESLSVKICKQ